MTVPRKRLQSWWYAHGREGRGGWRRARVAWLLLALLLGASTAQAQACGAGVEEGRRVVLAAENCVERFSDGEEQNRIFIFTLPAEPRGYRLVATADSPQPLRLCLGVEGGEACRNAPSPLIVSDLVLAGELQVRPLRLDFPTGTRYRISLEPAPLPPVERESEPNDEVALAHPLGSDLAIRGSLGDFDVDVYRVDITGEAQLWRVQAVGAGVERLALWDVRGTPLQWRDMERGSSTVRLSNLYLAPGSHWIAISGRSGDYALRLLPLGPADDPPGAGAPSTASVAPPMSVSESPLAASIPVERPSALRPTGRMEREPNDDASRAHLLRPGEPYVGLLSEPGDFDLYRLALPVEGYGRITLTTPPEGVVRIDIGGRRVEVEGGQRYLYEGWWLAGDHLLSLSTRVASEGYYQLLFELLDPLSLPDDLEPNDRPHQASPLPIDGRVVGEVGQHNDDDVYRLPTFGQETEVRFRLQGEGVSVHSIRDLRDEWVAEVTFERGSSEGRAQVPAGGPYAVRLRGRGSYSLEVEIGRAAPSVEPRAGPPQVEISITGPRDIAAFRSVAQRLDLEVQLRNLSTLPLELELEAAIGASQWTAHFGDPTPSLAAGESRRIPLALEAAPWARDDLPIAVHVGARARGGGEAVSARHDVVALCGAAPLAPSRRWPIPEPFLGGFDVAARSLGALPQSDVRRELLLYDGRVRPDDGYRAEVGSSSTVMLAGEDPPHLLGVILHPLSDTEVAGRARDFRIWTSLDGVQFDVALEGRMGSEAREQGFLFPTPHAARFARLEVLSRQDGRIEGPFGLGAFKVIAEPGTPLSRDLLNIAHPNLGGRVVDAEPFLRPLAFDGSAATPRTFRNSGAEVYWIIGFSHGRAGWLHSLGWQPHPQGNPAQAISEVRVSLASDSPLGPWTVLGNWRPTEVPLLELQTPVWARYVRFDAVELDASQRNYELPLTVSIFESPADRGYRSLVGEWGYAERHAVWEWLESDRVENPWVESSNRSRESALLIPEGGVASSSVSVGAYDAWFAVDVPAGANFLDLTLRGDPVPRYQWRLLDAAGEEVFAEVSGAGDALQLSALIEPGRYYLHAWEPIRSVVFSWDDSGSMGPYIDVSYQAVASFIRGLDPASEAVQLQAFGDDPRFLLPDWSADPEQVSAVLTRYPRDQDSSEVESNLGFVVEALAKREGARAIILITDAGGSFTTGGPEVNRNLWDVLDAVRPQIFSFETDTAGTFVNQARMQDWAYSAGGAYDYARSMADFDVGLARVRCQLRQPKLVTVAARSDQREPPGPGALRVVFDDDDATLPAVMVVLDASGSMGKLLTGSRVSRWEAAQAVVARLLADELPDEVQFGLRVYGHVLPGSCDTELVIPPAPLQRPQAAARLASLEPKLFSGTPLGASILALIDDLAAVRSAKRVVLITDGEESCGADPEAALVALRSAHPDLALSIVGFDFDAENPAEARARFARWAELGGGRYLEAGDESTLLTALTEGLAEARSFEVFDAAGVRVAEGNIGGDALPLPAGRYSVRLRGGSGETREVSVPSEREVTLTLAAP